MDDTSEHIESTANKIRAVIEEFLKGRLQPKLDDLDKQEKKLEEDDLEALDELQLKRDKLLESYGGKAWIADAAKRVAQIQQVTHAVKYLHPDARGTCLHKAGNAAAGESTVGSHSIRRECEPDAVFYKGAKDLDVYSFLRLEVDGVSLMTRAFHNDPALQAALGGYSEESQTWIDAFADITQNKGELSSHRLVKQIYWPLGDGDYHLLAPLFPTSLAHVVWQTIRRDRAEAKKVWDARKKGESVPDGYCEYRDLAFQKFGGSKPQNISQLNSERHGENYLLPSFPPTWNSEAVKPPLYIKSVFDKRFGSRKRVRELVEMLSGFLVRARDYTNIRIREKRAELAAAVIDELLIFASDIQGLPAGWSGHEHCRLNQEERCWLDPGRALNDEAFRAECLKGEWKEKVCRRFGNWFNARFIEKKLNMGQDEAREWQSILNKELNLMRQEMDAHD